jgi:hypothetical protein
MYGYKQLGIQKAMQYGFMHILFSRNLLRCSQTTINKLHLCMECNGMV